jgi:Flp pilus assembly protein TadG
MVLPIVLTVVFGIVLFGSYLAVVHGVQQLTAEAARASVAGMTETERSTAASPANAIATRVLLQVQLVGSGAASVVELPVYSELAQGVATLNKVSCGYPNIDTSVVAPGILDA